MKKFSEFRNKLTSKQASRWCLAFSIILALIVVTLIEILVVSSSPPTDYPNVVSIIILITHFLTATAALTAICFYLLDITVFNIDEKTWMEKHEITKEKIISQFGLTTQARTKVTYNFKKSLKDTHDSKMLTKLLEITEYNFYLKLVNDEDIELTVTDKHENIVYTDTFDNFHYLEEYFEKIS